MKTRFIKAGAFALLAALPFEVPQEIPVLKDVRLTLAVTRSGSLFTYTYTVSSGATSTGQIGTWSLDLTQPPGGVTLSSEGLVHGPGFAMTTQTDPFPGTPKMVPVGVVTPLEWTGGFHSRGGVLWGGGDDFDILPGQTLTGFVLTSRGLPGIRGFVISPEFYLEVDENKMTGPEDERAALKREDEIQAQIAVRGKTVGPTAPPANFQPLAFLAYITGLKDEAMQQGWISTRGVATSLAVKLNAAKRALERGEVGTTTNTLHALVNEVEAQAGKALTPEAVALLTFNTEFLLSRLATPSPPTSSPGSSPLTSVR